MNHTVLISEIECVFYIMSDLLFLAEAFFKVLDLL